MSRRDPGHESLVPFEDLARDVQGADDPFVKAIHAVRLEPIDRAPVSSTQADHVFAACRPGSA